MTRAEAQAAVAKVYRWTSAEVLTAVAKIYRVSEAELTGRSRRRPLPEARRVTAYVLHAECGMAWDDVSDVFGWGYGGWAVETARKAPWEGVRLTRFAMANARIRARNTA